MNSLILLGTWRKKTISIFAGQLPRKTHTVSCIVHYRRLFFPHLSFIASSSSQEGRRSTFRFQSQGSTNSVFLDSHKDGEHKAHNIEDQWHQHGLSISWLRSRSPFPPWLPRTLVFLASSASLPLLTRLSCNRSRPPWLRRHWRAIVSRFLHRHPRHQRPSEASGFWILSAFTRYSWLAMIGVLLSPGFSACSDQIVSWSTWVLHLLLETQPRNL